MGISYVGASKEKLGEAACCAVKRINLDNRVAKKAKSAGAELKEGFEVGVMCVESAVILCCIFFFLFFSFFLFFPLFFSFFSTTLQQSRSFTL
jgi:hypothetical protein